MELKQLIDAYQRRIDAHYKEIEIKCAKPINGEERKLSPAPNYVTEVIIPVLCSVAKKLPGYKIKIPDAENYYPKKGYYRIKAGITLIGGFVVPEKEDYSLYFVPMLHVKPSSEKYLINCTEMLAQLIKDQLKTE